jgi:urea transporter/murein DD-endopeptidase MepM/ murein hydrolase activator NlpD
MQKLRPLKSIVFTILNSYSQIFFSQSKVLGGLLILASFFDIWAGFYGLLSVVAANITAYLSGFSKHNSQNGLYGFNALLVGLGIGFYYQPSIELTALVLFAAILSILITLAVEGVFYKYSLPFLSVPFIISLWLVFTASLNFDALQLSERNLFTYNELYALGGKNFTEIYGYIQNYECCPIIRTYLMSLGAIIFQPNILAGVLVFIGLLHYSRIALTLSLLGFFAAFAFYSLLGSDFNELAYNNIGFNYILTSIAVGGFFIIPSLRSYLWVLLLLPITVIITVSSQKILAQFGLAVYALPFNMVVLLFLYVMKLRLFPSKLEVNYTGQKSPEESLYLNKIQNLRFKNKPSVDIALPFWGEWKVTQGYNGKYTHKGEWQHALDFEISDASGSTYKNEGDLPNDYYCYEKYVSAPADGTVADIIDNISDNKIGETNTRQNWGNTIIIKHNEYIYSQLSHLKEGSFKVKKGEAVKKSQILAQVGNSGHSPYPHLHFQMQLTAQLGAPTLPYPFENYIVKDGDKNRFGEGIPKENQKVYKPSINEVLQKAFSFVPGQTLNCINEKGETVKWNIDKDPYNFTFIKCKKTGARAYYEQNDEHFYFSNFYGSKRSELFTFFKAAYRVKFVFIENTRYEEAMQINFSFPKYRLFFHDFIAPFVMLLKTEYTFVCKKYNDTLADSPVEAETLQRNLFLDKILSTKKTQLSIKPTGKIYLSGEQRQLKIQKSQRIQNS